MPARSDFRTAPRPIDARAGRICDVLQSNQPDASRGAPRNDRADGTPRKTDEPTAAAARRRTRVAPFLRELSTGVEAEVKRHFDFEENHLFAFLATLGDRAIGDHLTDEHSAMRPLGERIAALTRAAESAGFSDVTGKSSAVSDTSSSNACSFMCRRRRWRCSLCSKTRWTANGDALVQRVCRNLLRTAL